MPPTNHGSALRILATEVVPALEKFEKLFAGWTAKNQKYNAMWEQMQEALMRTREAVKLLRKGH